MSSGNSQQRRKFQNKTATSGADKMGVKRFTWKHIISEPISAELAAGLFWSFAILALDTNNPKLSLVFFAVGALFLFLRVVVWANGYVREDRRRVLTIGILAWFVCICLPPSYFIYLETKPAFVLIWPLNFDSAQQRQDFLVFPSWKPLTDVQIFLIDNSSALALGRHSAQAMHRWSFPEVSSSYLTPDVSWVKPVPFSTHIEDFYLLNSASHEGGNYSEELTIQHSTNGGESFLMKIYDSKNKPVFRCEHSPGPPSPKEGTVFECSNH